MDRHILDTLPVVWVLTVIRQSSCSEFWVHSFCCIRPLPPRCSNSLFVLGRCSSQGIVSLCLLFLPSGRRFYFQRINCEARFGLLHTFERYFSNSILLRKMFVQAILHFHQQAGCFFLLLVALSNTGFYCAPHYLVLAILFDDNCVSTTAFNVDFRF